MCSDPLAFQWLSKGSLSHPDTRFIDVDFPELMEKKCDVIANTPQLRDLLGPYQIPEKTNGAHLRSKHYCALGCDLADIARLDALLANEIDTSRSLILCIAEVSVTYMDVGAADSLIEWAAHYDNGTLRFQNCLLLHFVINLQQYASVFLNNVCLTVQDIRLPKK